MNRHKRQPLVLCLGLLLCGCAGLPPAPVPVQTPTEVILKQHSRKSSNVLRLVNQASFDKVGPPKDAGTKVSPDPELSRLLQGLAMLSYFEQSVPFRQVGERGYLAVVTPGRVWYLCQPDPNTGLGCLPGEGYKAAADRYQRLMGVFLGFYNQTEYYHPVKNREGRNYFLRQQQRLQQGNRTRKEGL